jgi:hypothetical protein
MKKIILALLVASSLVGCASVPMGDPAKDAALKTFAAPAADKAGLYIYRNESMGAAVKMDVSVDGQPIGQTVANSYLYKEVAPGKHTIASTAENTDAIEIEAKPGSLNFIWQEVKMGILYARTKLHSVNDADGKKGVSETKLAAGQ